MAETVSELNVLNTAHQINANYVLSLVAYTILYYDYTLTISDEVRFFWGRKYGSITILFYINRYLSIIGIIPVILQSFADWTPSGCNILQKYHQFLAVLVQVIVGTIQIIRTYAMYELNRRIAFVLATFAAIVIGLGVWASLGPSNVQAPFDLSSFPGCHPLIGNEAGIRLAVAWSCLVAFDTVIFALTLYKAFSVRGQEISRLFHILIRDGSVYYLVLVMVNLSNIFSFVYGEPVLKGVSTTFANAMSSALISHLLLNLQNPLLFETSSAPWRTVDENVGTFAVATRSDLPTAFSSGVTSLDSDDTVYWPKSHSHGQGRYVRVWAPETHYPDLPYAISSVTEEFELSPITP